MAKVLYFCQAVLVLFQAEILAAESNVEEIFDVLSDRLDHLAMERYELKAKIENNVSTINAQISDIAYELNDMSERMNDIFSDFGERDIDGVKVNGGMVEYIQSLVQAELSEEKQVLRNFVDRFERELENLASYVSDNVAFKNQTIEPTELSNEIPTSDRSTGTCEMCMLVATVAEKKARRIEQELEVLTNNTLKREREYAALQHDVGDTFEKVLELEDIEQDQANSLDKVTNDVDELRDFVNTLNEKHERKIGFTARLTKVRDFYPGNVLIVFDEVKYNQGNGYDSLSGIFTAPKSGTYLMSFNVQSTERYDAHVCLIVNGTLRLTAVAGEGHRITGGNTGIVYMEMGEQAWVRTTTLKPRFGIWPHRTTFSGVLLD